MLRSFLLTAVSVLFVSQSVSYRPVATNAQIMRALIVPASDALFDAPDAPTNEEWAHLEDQALILAESGNLLMIGPRAADATWVRQSRALVDQGGMAYEAVQAKDVDRLLKTTDEILATCKACHQRYAIK